MQDINTYLIYAYHEAISLGHCYVGSQHFLLSLLHHHRLFADVMKQYQDINESITRFLQERCSVAAELLLRHGMKGEEIARTYQNLLIG